MKEEDKEKLLYELDKRLRVVEHSIDGNGVTGIGESIRDIKITLSKMTPGLADKNAETMKDVEIRLRELEITANKNIIKEIEKNINDIKDKQLKQEAMVKAGWFVIGIVATIFAFIFTNFNKNKTDYEPKDIQYIQHLKDSRNNLINKNG